MAKPIHITVRHRHVIDDVIKDGPFGRFRRRQEAFSSCLISQNPPSARRRAGFLFCIFPGKSLILLPEPDANPARPPEPTRFASPSTT